MPLKTNKLDSPQDSVAWNQGKKREMKTPTTYAVCGGIIKKFHVGVHECVGRALSSATAASGLEFR